ncbi:MAG: LysR family transcriptional regulator, partial [Amylibacter sp.]
MLNDPPITVLRALKSIERTGSVSKTAIELGLTQSAVSRSIATYEKILGLNLLRRDTRPITLTEEGELVVSHAVEIDRSIVTLNERLQAVKQNKAGTITIGSFGPT